MGRGGKTQNKMKREKKYSHLCLLNERLSESYLAMVGVYVGHNILLILIIHILATLIIPSLLSFSEIGISQVITITSLFLI